MLSLATLGNSTSTASSLPSFEAALAADKIVISLDEVRSMELSERWT
jgi:hypothetical protein